MLLCLKLFSLLLLASFYSKADCLPDVQGLCTPGVTITEDTQIDISEEDKGTEIITTTTTTVTTTTTTVTNENSGDILDGDNGYVVTNKEGDMDVDWGGQGSASMPSGNSCGQLGTDKCAMITGGGNSTSTMGVSGMGTTFINTIDISDLQIDNGGEVRYTIKVDKQDAQDRIYMHVSGFNGTTSVFSGTDILSDTGIASGYQSYNGSFDFSGILNKVTIEIGGRDINLAIGPLFDDVTVNVLYNVIDTIITQQITSVEEIVYLNIGNPTELDLIEEIIEYNDITIDESGEIEFVPIETPQEDITYETVEIEIDFEVENIEPEIEVQVASIEAEMEAEIEMVEAEEEITEEPQEELQEPEQETPQTVQKEEDSEETVEEEKSSEPKISDKEKAATKIVKKIDDKARYDDAAQTKTLIVMQILGNTKTFFDSQATITDTNVEEYLLKTIDDKYGILFSNSQNNIMEQMINGQY